MEENSKKPTEKMISIWSGAGKISLLTILFGMLCFFDGCYKQKTDKQEENKPAVTVTNSVPHTSSIRPRIE